MERPFKGIRPFELLDDDEGRCQEQEDHDDEEVHHDPPEPLLGPAGSHVIPVDVHRIGSKGDDPVPGLEVILLLDQVEEGDGVDHLHGPSIEVLLHILS